MRHLIVNNNGVDIDLFNKLVPSTVTSAKQTWELLGNDLLNVTVKSAEPIPFSIGCTIVAFGRKYTLNRLPQVKKIEKRLFEYVLEFEGVQYDLLRVTYDLTINTTNSQLQDVQADTLIGDLRRFAAVFISNANRVFPGAWTLGDCPETIGDKTLTFGESDNCLSVLQKLCSEFNVEFEIEQKNGVYTINFAEKVGQIFPHTFQFGKGKGLYSLDRQNVDSSNIVTRLKVYGSTSNITHKYRANRLCLPGKAKGQSYIEKPEAVAKYGIYEATKYFEDIKPTFNGVVTGVVSDNILQFADENMFDLNAKDENGTLYLLNGVAAKIHFNSGNLAGYEFNVHSFDYETKTFTLVQITDERDDKFPSEKSQAFQFNIGDKYKILDVALPPEYEMEAENRLASDGNTYYDQNSQPKVQYGLSVTKDYLKQFVGDGTAVNIFAPGDYIPIVDADIDVNKSIRIKSLTRNLLDEYEYGLTISDTVTTNITNRVISELIEHDKIITTNNLKDPARARNNWRSAQELLSMVFDPEGDYYTEKIKPQSIETLALSVGAKSMQFGLTNTVLQPNYNGDKNIIKVQGGILTHYTIDENSARSWVLANNTTSFDKDSQAYYIYAKCERSGQGGSIIFSTEQIKAEQDAGYYHFWIGVVNSVDSELNARSIALSYGFTMINGRFIKTGRIESSGGSGSFFDLDENQFRIGTQNKGLSWNINGDGKLVLKGSMVQSGSGDESPLGCFRGEFDPDCTYHEGDEVAYQGSSYRYIHNEPSSGKLPTDTTYWAVIASAGADGVSGAYPSFVFKKSETQPATPTGTNPIPSGWDDAPSESGIWWMSKATVSYQGGQWLAGAWSVPVRVTGEDGEPGEDGKFWDYKYRVAATQPATPTGLQPSGWSDTPPSVTSGNYLWMSFCEKNAAQTVILKAWSAPVRISGEKGEDGVGGSLSISTDGQVFKYNNAAFTGTPSPATINLRADIPSGASAAYWYYLNGASEVSISTGATLAVAHNASYLSGVSSRTIRAKCTWNGQTLTDEITLVKVGDGTAGTNGVDAYTVILTNESHTVACDANGNPLSGELNSSKASTSVIAYRGSTQLTPAITAGNGTYSISVSATGCTTTINGAIVYITAMSADSAQVEITINCEGKQSIAKVMSLTKSKAGANGKDGLNGTNGKDGAKGDLGAAIVYRGVYNKNDKGEDEIKTYYGNSQRQDVVKYNGNYYVALVNAGTFSNVLPTNILKWNTFGAQYESVATNLLLAELANIAGWIFRNQRLESQSGNAFLDGANGQLSLSGGKILLKEDGSGQLANGNVVWDAAGNVTVRGKFESTINGNRIIIDPSAQKLQMLNSNSDKVLDVGFVVESTGQSNASIMAYSYDQNRNIIAYTNIRGGLINVYDLFRVTANAGGLTWWADPTKLPTSASTIGQIYRSGNNLCIRTS